MRMITVEIQGQQVQADLLNPEVMKKVEDGFDTVIEKYHKAAEECRVGSEGIRRQCQAVIDYVTDIFGEAGAKKILGSQTDLLTCTDVLEEIFDMYEKQINPQIREKGEKLRKKMGAHKKQ